MRRELKGDPYLIEKYLNGDKSALTMLIQKWDSVLRSKAYWILKDHELTKDILQDCWMIIAEQLGALRNREHFKSWAMRIVYSKSVDALKSRAKSQENKEKFSRLKFNRDDETVKEKSVMKKDLYSAIQSLSREKQDVIRLFYKEEYSIREISEILNVSIGTVKSRLFKAREKLKMILKKRKYEK